MNDEERARAVGETIERLEKQLTPDHRIAVDALLTLAASRAHESKMDRGYVLTRLEGCFAVLDADDPVGQR